MADLLKKTVDFLTGRPFLGVVVAVGSLAHVFPTELAPLVGTSLWLVTLQNLAGGLGFIAAYKLLTNGFKK